MSTEEKSGIPKTEAPAEKAVETKETPPAITPQSVVDKAHKGEKLSPEETEVFKGLPPGGMPAPTEAKKEETPAPTPKTEEKKTESQTTPETITKERRDLIEAELSKPDAEVDLSKFKSPVELGLYWDLKKARRKNARLEDQLETERVERIVERLQGKKTTSTAEEETSDAEILNLLKDLKSDDIVTVADIQAALKKQTDARAAKAAKKEEKPSGGLMSMEQIRIEKVEADNLLRSKGITDFHEVTDFAESALKNDPEAVEILRDTAMAKGNTALKTYYLVKGSRAWPEIEKIIKAEREKASGKKEETPAENLKRAEKIEENDGKTKTTGAGTGANANPNEFTMAEIQNMTASQVKKLSKKQREEILKKFGSTPNYSV